MAKTGYHRADRVADQIRMEVADILMRKIKDPRVQSVTVTVVPVVVDLTEPPAGGYRSSHTGAILGLPVIIWVSDSPTLLAEPIMAWTKIILKPVWKPSFTVTLT